MTAPGYSARIPHKPTYTLHPSFPVRRVMWRPSYECEIAIVSNAEFGTGSNSDLSQNSVTSDVTRNSLPPQHSNEGVQAVREQQQQNAGGDAIEIWDVRRGWIAKWCVTGSAIEGGVTGNYIAASSLCGRLTLYFSDIAFGDSHAVWSQHSSGMFSQIDLRDAIKPSDAIPRVAATWEASGSLTFVADRKTQWEVPYDDVQVISFVHLSRRLLPVYEPPGDAITPLRLMSESLNTKHWAISLARLSLRTWATTARIHLRKISKSLLSSLAAIYLKAGREKLYVLSTQKLVSRFFILHSGLTGHSYPRSLFEPAKIELHRLGY